MGCERQCQQGEAESVARAHWDAFVRCVSRVCWNRCVIRRVGANRGGIGLWGSQGRG